MKHPNFHNAFKETAQKIKETSAGEVTPRPSRFFNGGGWVRATVLGLSVAIAAAIIVGGVISYQWYYQDKFYPGTNVAGIALGGESFTAAQEKIARRADYVEQYGIPVRYRNAEFKLIASPVASSPDLTFDLFAYDIDKTLVRAWEEGRDGTVLHNAIAQARLLLFSPHEPMQGFLDQERIRAALQDRFAEFEEPARDAAIVATAEGITITPEAPGQVFDYESAVRRLITQFHSFNTEPVELSLVTDTPSVTADDLTAIKDDAARALQLAPFTLVTPTSTAPAIDEQEFAISRGQLTEWIGAATNGNGTVQIALKETPVTEWLASSVAPTIDIDPVNAKFAIEDGKVTEFKSSRDGYKTDPQATLHAINEALQTAVADGAGNPNAVTIVMQQTHSDITNENVNDLGITELLGTGHSNFAGSPANRRHNIRIGAASVNGTLLAPGEEFSLLEVLGDINASTGYLPELVIKGNETVPEYGGGLCQIGTTVFRATVDTGLPVTERRNHSYRVSYYEPAGTDATIYDPAPDYKFVNDTEHYILIQSRIEGDDLYFDVWGTDDGRVAEAADPVIYNITPPPPTKIIETTNLEPGKRKCTESAHSGADAYFDYTVTYPDGETEETRFTSHYRPWQEVCLVGVEKEKEDSQTEGGIENAATTTEAAP